ncbi:hypothetical protein OTU49_008698 [Cherax quadricarinatus]|uniref:Cysteine protease n=1 Tax=Cherax quadricarinatus TaxID=27406 RepID=A0AAW0WPI8_CHEQU
MEAFKEHLHILVWCTCQRQFTTLQDSSLTIDCDWGCMLRTAQTMLAHSLIRHFLTRVYIQGVLDLFFTSCVCNRGNVIKLAKDIHLKPDSSSSSSSLYPDERSLAAMDLPPSHTLTKDTKASEAKYNCNEKPGQEDDGGSGDEVLISGRKSTKESQKETLSDTHDKSSTDEEKKLGSGHLKEARAV